MGVDTALTIQAVIQMVAAGVPTAAIIQTIESAPVVDFSFVPSQLAMIANGRVPDDVVKAIAWRATRG